ncbi:MAG: HAMP domain-containing histidine kinase [Clostridia bacterium]|nr:HAMP domain-containing histidine kinase [Clostridia bacterium]
MLIVTDGFVTYSAEEYEVYTFENDFSESSFVSYQLHRPENIIYSVYQSIYYEQYDHFNSGNPKTFLSENRETIEQRLKDEFSFITQDDKIDYYVKWNDLILTNCNVKSAEELQQGEFYLYAERDKNGTTRSGNFSNRDYFPLTEHVVNYDTESSIAVGCSIKQEVIDEYREIWERQEKIVLNTFSQASICVLAALISLIYLLCVCGKNKDGEYRTMWVDNIWAEVHLAFIVGSGLLAAAACICVLEEYMYREIPNHFVYTIIGGSAGIASLMIISSLLSIIRNIKCRRLLETSLVLQILRLILRILKWGFGIIGKTVKWILGQCKAFWSAIFRMLSKKTGIILISLLLLYTVVMYVFGIGTPFSPIWLILAILTFIFACFVVAFRAKDLDEIKKGVSEVRNGNVAYKIPELKSDDMKAMAVNINDIAKGLDESVSAKVKAERLKTELITNVSHDLKTPITSIINYTELLSKMAELPEEAQDYVSVIAKKSDRLKKLTQDLFDISKVQSGNDDVVLEKLDVALLIDQALGEHDNEIQESGLPFCVNAPKELYISADGRKMSRVVSNLISNILKYSMKNTRVFITALEKNGTVIMEFKNISAYPLDLDVEEITQRFVRGDESRTTEGNGLGLAIAKSYTEICNGTFEIVTDGDLFKAILKFRKFVL